jgi:hypothetical protein
MARHDPARIPFEKPFQSLDLNSMKMGSSRDSDSMFEIHEVFERYSKLVRPEKGPNSMFRIRALVSVQRQTTSMASWHRFLPWVRL